MSIDRAAVKRELRKSIIGRRDALSGDSRMEMSAVITGKLTELEACRGAAVVLAYMSFGSEFETAGFARHIVESGKTL
ncbi:MAG TPA: 5-formyltetrahydrofolate cyclo-ligase, partial [Burkholderiales bacterium]|nr:5-formyltetrahydrofolate cyclo-ligase [Burkholderiales bacterium]